MVLNALLQPLDGVRIATPHVRGAAATFVAGNAPEAAGVVAANQKCGVAIRTPSKGCKRALAAY